MLRVGIVGAGFAARFHLAAWRRVHGVKVLMTGVTARSAGKRAAFAQANGMRAFDSLEAMLPEVDVVDICTPGNTHEAFAVAALKAGKHVILEKPFTGFYGPKDGDASFSGLTFDREAALAEVLASCGRIRAAALESGRFLCYAENWVYAPTVQKEREILEKTGGQVLRMLGEESHSGSHAPSYGWWSQSGGGALASKGCHPLSGAVYFKFVEGRARNGQPIFPVSVSANIHRITQLPGYRDDGYLRTDYHDTEDYGQMHIVFSDGTVADILSSDLVLGGVTNWIEVFAGNHRTRCNLNPVDAMETFSPGADTLKDVYIVEKLHPKQGWMKTSPDEDWMHGYPQEIQAFAEAIESGRVPESSGMLGEVVTAVLYAAYLSASRQGQSVPVPPFRPEVY